MNPRKVVLTRGINAYRGRLNTELNSVKQGVEHLVAIGLSEKAARAALIMVSRDERQWMRLEPGAIVEALDETASGNRDASSRLLVRNSLGYVGHPCKAETKPAE